MKSGITVHCRVRNEEQFVSEAILSVLPLAERVLVYDTGSTDHTLQKIASIQNDKIEVICKPPSDPKGICAYRNEMIDRTDTEWYMIVDGDKVYPQSAVECIQREMLKLADKKDIHRIVLHRHHFVRSLNFVSKPDGIGRIYRTKAIKFNLFNPDDNRVGHETPYYFPDPALPPYRYSVTFPPEAYFFHFHHLRRSSQDNHLGKLRRWRKTPFPLSPFFGPWPEGIETGAAARSLNLFIAAQCAFLNIWSPIDRLIHKMPWVKKVRGSQLGDRAASA